MLIDPSTRPHGPSYDEATLAALRQRSTLVRIHDHLRDELARVRAAVEAVCEGHGEVAEARSLVQRMTMRQDYWSLGAFCAAYCRVLSIHHTIEDEHVFTQLRHRDRDLGPVLDRLSEEHEVIAGALDRVDVALVALVDRDAAAQARTALDELGDALLSHLDYEETELVGPIESLGLLV